MAITPKKKLPKLAGKPLDTNILRREVAGPSLVSIRNIFSENLSASLTPAAAAGYAIEAQQGYPWNWLDIAEGMEEKWAHYRAVIETRKRAIIGLERTITPASEDPEHIAHANFVRDYVKQDAFTDLLFDMLDALSKGFSVIECTWDTNRPDGTWLPKSLKWRDPRWFAIDPNDGESLLIRDNTGYYPIEPITNKFIVHKAKTKSGILIRGGLAYAALGPFVMTQIIMKFWPAFLELYGMPLRVGKLKAGAQDADKTQLMNALAGIGSDAAAIITEWAEIEFKDAASKGSSSEVYKTFLEFLNDQISKVVLGQTFTMGGSGNKGSGLSHSGKVQDNVRLDILQGDVRQLCGSVNPTIIKWLVDLNFPPPADGQYPKFDMPVKETEDMDKKAQMLGILTGPNVNAGLTQRWLRGLVGAPDPEDGDIMSNGSVFATPLPAGNAGPAVEVKPASPSPVLPMPPEDGPAFLPNPFNKIINPATPGQIDPNAPPIVPPPNLPQPWGQVVTQPNYSFNRVVDSPNRAEQLKKVMALAKKYKAENQAALTMQRVDAAIAETQSVTQILADEIRKAAKK